MSWSIELIRDGFCAGLGFWGAYLIFLGARSFGKTVAEERNRVLLENSLKRQAKLKRQIDER